MDVDLERLELRVAQCTLQTLLFKNEHGTYALSNSHARPAWRIISFQPAWPSSSTSFERQGLNTILELTERIYSEFYVWLLSTFPKVQGCRPAQIDRPQH